MFNQDRVYSPVRNRLIIFLFFRRFSNFFLFFVSEVLSGTGNAAGGQFYR